MRRHCTAIQAPIGAALGAAIVGTHLGSSVLTNSTGPTSTLFVLPSTRSASAPAIGSALSSSIRFASSSRGNSASNKTRSKTKSKNSKKKDKSQSEPSQKSFSSSSVKKTEKSPTVSLLSREHTPVITQPLPTESLKTSNTTKPYSAENTERNGGPRDVRRSVQREIYSERSKRFEGKYSVSTKTALSATKAHDDDGDRGNGGCSDRSRSLNSRDKSNKESRLDRGSSSRSFGDTDRDRERDRDRDRDGERDRDKSSWRRTDTEGRERRGDRRPDARDEYRGSKGGRSDSRGSERDRHERGGRERWREGSLRTQSPSFSRHENGISSSHSKARAGVGSVSVHNKSSGNSGTSVNNNSNDVEKRWEDESFEMDDVPSSSKSEEVSGETDANSLSEQSISVAEQTKVIENSPTETRAESSSPTLSEVAGSQLKESSGSNQHGRFTKKSPLIEKGSAQLATLNFGKKIETPVKLEGTHVRVSFSDQTTSEEKVLSTPMPAGADVASSTARAEHTPSKSVQTHGMGSSDSHAQPSPSNGLAGTIATITHTRLSYPRAYAGQDSSVQTTPITNLSSFCQTMRAQYKSTKRQEVADHCLHQLGGYFANVIAPKLRMESLVHLSSLVDRGEGSTAGREGGSEEDAAGDEDAMVLDGSPSGRSRKEEGTALSNAANGGAGDGNGSVGPWFLPVVHDDAFKVGEGGRQISPSLIVRPGVTKVSSSSLSAATPVYPQHLATYIPIHALHHGATSVGASTPTQPSPDATGSSADSSALFSLSTAIDMNSPEFVKSSLIPREAAARIEEAVGPLGVAGAARLLNHITFFYNSWIDVEAVGAARSLLGITSNNSLPPNAPTSHAIIGSSPSTVASQDSIVGHAFFEHSASSREDDVDEASVFRRSPDPADWGEFSTTCRPIATYGSGTSNTSASAPRSGGKGGVPCPHLIAVGLRQMYTSSLLRRYQIMASVASGGGTASVGKISATPTEGVPPLTAVEASATRARHHSAAVALLWINLLTKYLAINHDRLDLVGTSLVLLSLSGGFRPPCLEAQLLPRFASCLALSNNRASNELRRARGNGDDTTVAASTVQLTSATKIELVAIVAACTKLLASFPTLRLSSVSSAFPAITSPSSSSSSPTSAGGSNGGGGGGSSTTYNASLSFSERLPTSLAFLYNQWPPMLHVAQWSKHSLVPLLSSFSTSPHELVPILQFLVRFNGALSNVLSRDRFGQTLANILVPSGSREHRMFTSSSHRTEIISVCGDVLRKQWALALSGVVGGITCSERSLGSNSEKGKRFNIDASEDSAKAQQNIPAIFTPLLWVALVEQARLLFAQSSSVRRIGEVIADASGAFTAVDATSSAANESDATSRDSEFSGVNRIGSIRYGVTVLPHSAISEVICPRVDSTTSSSSSPLFTLSQTSSDVLLVTSEDSCFVESLLTLCSRRLTCISLLGGYLLSPNTQGRIGVDAYSSHTNALQLWVLDLCKDLTMATRVVSDSLWVGKVLAGEDVSLSTTHADEGSASLTSRDGSADANASPSSSSDSLEEDEDDESFDGSTKLSPSHMLSPASIAAKGAFASSKMGSAPLLPLSERLRIAKDLQSLLNSTNGLVNNDTPNNGLTVLARRTMYRLEKQLKALAALRDELLTLSLLRPDEGFDWSVPASARLSLTPSFITSPNLCPLLSVGAGNAPKIAAQLAALPTMVGVMLFKEDAKTEASSASKPILESATTADAPEGGTGGKAAAEEGETDVKPSETQATTHTTTAEASAVNESADSSALGVSTESAAGGSDAGNPTSDGLQQSETGKDRKSLAVLSNLVIKSLFGVPMGSSLGEPDLTLTYAVTSSDKEGVNGATSSLGANAPAATPTVISIMTVSPRSRYPYIAPPNSSEKMASHDYHRQMTKALRVLSRRLVLQAEAAGTAAVKNSKDDEGDSKDDAGTAAVSPITANTDGNVDTSATIGVDVSKLSAEDLRCVVAAIHTLAMHHSKGVAGITQWRAAKRSTAVADSAASSPKGPSSTSSASAQPVAADESHSAAEQTSVVGSEKLQDAARAAIAKLLMHHALTDAVGLDTIASAFTLNILSPEEVSFAVRHRLTVAMGAAAEGACGSNAHASPATAFHDAVYRIVLEDFLGVGGTAHRSSTLVALNTALDAVSRAAFELRHEEEGGHVELESKETSAVGTNATDANTEAPSPTDAKEVDANEDEGRDTDAGARDGEGVEGSVPSASASLPAASHKKYSGYRVLASVAVELALAKSRFAQYVSGARGGAGGGSLVLLHGELKQQGSTSAGAAADNALDNLYDFFFYSAFLDEPHGVGLLPRHKPERAFFGSGVYMLSHLYTTFASSPCWVADREQWLGERIAAGHADSDGGEEVSCTESASQSFGPPFITRTALLRQALLLDAPSPHHYACFSQPNSRSTRPSHHSLAAATPTAVASVVAAADRRALVSVTVHRASLCAKALAAGYDRLLLWAASAASALDVAWETKGRGPLRFVAAQNGGTNTTPSTEASSVYRGVRPSVSNNLIHRLRSSGLEQSEDSSAQQDLSSSSSSLFVAVPEGHSIPPSLIGPPILSSPAGDHHNLSQLLKYALEILMNRTNSNVGVFKRVTHALSMLRGQGAVVEVGMSLVVAANRLYGDRKTQVQGGAYDFTVSCILHPSTHFGVVMMINALRNAPLTVAMQTHVLRAITVAGMGELVTSQQRSAVVELVKGGVLTSGCLTLQCAALRALAASNCGPSTIFYQLASLALAEKESLTTSQFGDLLACAPHVEAADNVLCPALRIEVLRRVRSVLQWCEVHALLPYLAVGYIGDRELWWSVVERFVEHMATRSSSSDEAGGRVASASTGGGGGHSESDEKSASDVGNDDDAHGGSDDDAEEEEGVGAVSFSYTKEEYTPSYNNGSPLYRFVVPPDTIPPQLRAALCESACFESVVVERTF